MNVTPDATSRSRQVSLCARCARQDRLRVRALTQTIAHSNDVLLGVVSTIVTLLQVAGMVWSTGHPLTNCSTAPPHNTLALSSSRWARSSVAVFDVRAITRLSVCEVGNWVTQWSALPQSKSSSHDISARLWHRSILPTPLPIACAELSNYSVRSAGQTTPSCFASRRHTATSSLRQALLAESDRSRSSWPCLCARWCHPRHPGRDLDRVPSGCFPNARRCHLSKAVEPIDRRLGGRQALLIPCHPPSSQACPTIVAPICVRVAPSALDVISRSAL